MIREVDLRARYETDVASKFTGFGKEGSGVVCNAELVLRYLRNLPEHHAKTRSCPLTQTHPKHKTSLVTVVCYISSRSSIDKTSTYHFFPGNFNHLGTPPFLSFPLSSFPNTFPPRTGFASTSTPCGSRTSISLAFSANSGFSTLPPLGT